MKYFVKSWLRDKTSMYRLRVLIVILVALFVVFANACSSGLVKKTDEENKQQLSASLNEQQWTTQSVEEPVLISAAIRIKRSMPH